MPQAKGPEAARGQPSSSDRCGSGMKALREPGGMKNGKGSGQIRADVGASQSAMFTRITSGLLNVGSGSGVLVELESGS